VGKTRRILQRD